MSVSGMTVHRWLNRAGVTQDGHTAIGRAAVEPDPLIFPDFPQEDLAVEDLIEIQCKRFETRKKSHDAHTWFPVSLRDDRPIGILWFGDPHVDDNGCNWPVLKRHTEICRQTEGLFGVNIGDTTNNWAGRLARLYAEQDASVKTARKYAKWLLLDSGVRWMAILVGNHDAWGDGAEVLAQMAKQHGTQQILVHDWEARFRLAFPSGWEPRIFAAHDFRGNSQWNPLHGAMKAGMMGEEAELYVCGHKHNYAQFSFENAQRGGVIQNFIRVRGYKFMDDYARHLGIAEQETGCAVMTLFEPSKKRITAFHDIEAGADYLTWLRREGCATDVSPAKPRSTASRAASLRGKTQATTRRTTSAKIRSTVPA